MQIIKTFTMTRPNTTVEFYMWPADVLTHMKTIYKQAGLIVTVASSLSADGLTETIERTFDSSASSDLWAADPVITAAADVAHAYNATNGIIVNVL